MIDKNKKIDEASRFFNIDLRYFWSEVKRIRLRKEISQLEMAEALGISQSTYARYENMEYLSITDARIEAICEKLLIDSRDMVAIPNDRLSHHGITRAAWLREKESVSYVRDAYQKYLESQIKKP